jgi:hypothetical protein
MVPDNKIPHAENPEHLTGIELKKPMDMAAGMPAVMQSAKHILAEMGMGRGLKSLFNLNQKQGTDCPGCAWPDPDDERSGIAEYCENGAKAIAEEATTKSLTADFFAKNSNFARNQVVNFSYINGFEPEHYEFYLKSNLIIYISFPVLNYIN